MLKFNNKTPRRIKFNGKNLQELVYNGVTVYLRRLYKSDGSFPITLEKAWDENLEDYKIYGESTQATQLELYNDNLWQDGYINFEGTYPTTSGAFPDAKYFVIKMKADSQIKMSVIDTGLGTIGRVRYINPATNQVLGTITSGDNNNWIRSTNYEDKGFKNTIFYALQDVDLAFLAATGVTNEITSLFWENAVPTPDTPIEVESVGENVIEKAPYVVINAQMYNCATPRHTALTANGGLSYIFPCKKGEKYTIEVTGDTILNDIVDYSLNRFRVATLAENPLSASTSLIPTIETYVNDNNITKYTITISDSNSKYVVVTVSFAGENYKGDNCRRSIKGIYKIPVKVSSKNLFERKIESANVSPEGKVSTSENYNLYIAKVQKNKQYIISNYDNSGAWVYAFFTKNPSLDDVSYNNTRIVAVNTGVDLSHTFTCPDGVEYIAVRRNKNYPNFQIEEGTTATDYTPYFEPRTENIYLDEPLRKVGDDADYIDFKNKKVVRKIKEIKDLSTLSYSQDATYSRFISALPNFSALGIRYTPFLSNGLISINKGEQLPDIPYDAIYSGMVSYNTIYIKSKTATLEEFLNRIKNINLFYSSKTPTEETIELPNIPLQQGDNIISVETKIQPSKGELEYWRGL